jgi:thioredoxin 1
MDTEQKTSVYGPEPAREEVDHLQGPVLLEFGTNWCDYCQAIQPDLAALLQKYPEVRHFRIEDGKGRPLGRTFKVRMWPTLVFMKDGQPIKQVSRPIISDIQEGLQAIAGPGSS